MHVMKPFLPLFEPLFLPNNAHKLSTESNTVDTVYTSCCQLVTATMVCNENFGPPAKSASRTRGLISVAKSDHDPPCQFWSYKIGKIQLSFNHETVSGYVTGQPVDYWDVRLCNGTAVTHPCGTYEPWLLYRCIQQILALVRGQRKFTTDKPRGRRTRCMVISGKTSND